MWRSLPSGGVSVRVRNPCYLGIERRLNFRSTSPLTLENKILIYKTVLKPVWTYGIEMWGCASKTNAAVIQRCQSKLLRTMVNAPWYVSNHILHTDLRIPYVRTVFQERIAKHSTTLTSHPNPLPGTTTTANVQQKTQTTMDVWPAALRKHRWMPS